MPSVRIWDMEDPSHPQIAEMTKGHKFGVACVVSRLIIIVCISITIVKCMTHYCSHCQFNVPFTFSHFEEYEIVIIVMSSSMHYWSSLR